MKIRKSSSSVICSKCRGLYRNLMEFNAHECAKENKEDETRRKTATTKECD